MKTIIAIALAATPFLVPVAAKADEVCMPSQHLKASLIDWYQESPVADQTSPTEQLWVSERTGTWTLVEFEADGNACVLAQGTDWEEGIERTELLAFAQ